MKKKFKKFICLTLSSVMIMGMSVTAFANETSTTTQSTQSTQSVEVITNEKEINQLLQEKGIYEQGEEVVAVIEMKGEAPANLPENRLIFREIYAEYYSRHEGTKSTAKYTNNYPAGSFHFNQSITSGWQLNTNLGLKTEVFETAIGYTLNSSTTESWTFNSQNYSYPITVKAYINYEKEYYHIYDDDLMYDDYIGSTTVERETGYTLKVTKR